MLYSSDIQHILNCNYVHVSFACLRSSTKTDDCDDGGDHDDEDGGASDREDDDWICGREDTTAVSDIITELPRRHSDVIKKSPQ